MSIFDWPWLPPGWLASDRSTGPCDVFAPLGALGEGSTWDLRVRPAAAPAAASGNLEIGGPGNLGIWRSGNLEIQKFGDQGTWRFRNVVQKLKSTNISSNPVCPTCRQCPKW